MTPVTVLSDCRDMRTSPVVVIALEMLRLTVWISIVMALTFSSMAESNRSTWTVSWEPL